MIVENKLRVQCLIQAICLSMYWYSDIGLSWLHGIHIVAQPLVFLAALHSTSSWAYWCALVIAVAVFLDFLVFWSWFVTVARCVDAPTPTCFVQATDEIGKLVLASVHLVTSVFQFFNLLRYESETVVRSQGARIQLVTWFLIVQDAMWLIVTSPSGLEWGLVVHPVLNFVLFWVSQSQDKNKFVVMGVLLVPLLLFDSMLVALGWDGETYEDEIMRCVLCMYILTDLIMLYCCVIYSGYKRKVQ